MTYINHQVMRHEGRSHSGDVSPQARLVHHFLEERARQTPSRTALVCGDDRLTFAQIDAAANRLAHGLIAQGIRPSDRVAVYLENSVECVIAIFGILKAGAVFSVVNASTKADKLRSILDDERAAGLITVNDTLRRRAVEAILPGLSISVLIWVNGLPAPAEERIAAPRFLAWDDLLIEECAGAPEVRTAGEDLGTIIYTSGTTGAPKGVMSSHDDMAFAIRSIVTYLDNRADDVIFCPLSLAFTYGLYQLFTAICVGATLVLEQNFIFPQNALKIMERERVTGFPGVPTTFALILGLKTLDRYDLSALRYITNAAAPLPIQHIKGIRAAFPQAAFYSMYGQTECKRTCYLPPEQLDARPGSVGVPIPGTQVYIVDEDGRPVPPGCVGELVVRGPHLMRGYWERPEETDKRLRPGPDSDELVLYTGDLFRMDAEGFLYFVSREDDIIKSRGEKVSPNEIENTLHRLDGVEDVAAVGVPDPILGEAIKVVVVLAEGAELTEREIRAQCARYLEDFMVPRYVEFRDELPKSSNGKTVRMELRPCVA